MGRADDAVRLSVAELRRVLPALRESEEQRSKRLSWSRFRRLHQAIAQHCRVTRRATSAAGADQTPHSPPRRDPSVSL